MHLNFLRNKPFCKFISQCINRSEIICQFINIFVTFTNNFLGFHRKLKSRSLKNERDVEQRFDLLRSFRFVIHAHDCRDSGHGS